MLHGAGGNGKHAAESYGWIGKADEARFLLIAPDASTVLADREANFLRNPRVWNDGSGRAGPNITASDDIGFLRALIDQAARQYGIDRKRVYVSGFSSGSSMTQRVGLGDGQRDRRHRARRRRSVRQARRPCRAACR